MNKNILVILWWHEKERDLTAKKILQEKGVFFDFVIISGNKKEDNISKHYLKKYIPKGKLLIERHSRDTFTNMWFVHQELKKHLHKYHWEICLDIITCEQHYKRVFCIWNATFLGLRIFPERNIKNIASWEKLWNHEKKALRYFRMSSVFMGLGVLYTFWKRKFK